MTADLAAPLDDGLAGFKDETARILGETAHRPYPLAAGPWVMRQRWNDLLFAHWRVSPALVAAQLPEGLEVDTYDGSAWLGVVPFWMDQVRHRLPGLRSVRPVSVPTASCFPELNLRTYVRSRRSGKRGVFFFALECASPLAVLGARVLFHLPYYLADIKHGDTDGVIDYRSRRLLSRRSVQVGLTYRPTGPVRAPAEPGSLDSFLTERYCLFTAFAGRILRGEVHHQPWPLQPAEAIWSVNELPAAHGFTLPQTAPVLHFSRELQVLIWPLRVD